MKKLLLATTISGALLLGACGNGESDSKQDTQLSAEKQEDVYKKEAKKLGEAIVKEEERDSDKVDKKMMKDLDKAVKRYEDKTEDLDSVETEIGDYAARVANTMVAFGNRYIDLEDFKKDNPDKEDSYDLALVDVTVNLAQTLDSINMDYEDFDAEYKNEYLGKEANESIADLLSEFPSNEMQDVIDGYGAMIIAYDEDLNEEQTKVLSDTDYRKAMNKAMITEEPDVSKNEYNESVEKFNSLSPEFLHYDKINKIVSATENIAMTDLRNGVVGANTDAELDDYDLEDEEEPAEEEIDDIEDEDLETDASMSDEDESEDDDEELEWVEDEDGEMHLEGSL